MRFHHKLRKRLALVSLADAFCLSVGTVAHEKIKPIARKNHGYRATSLSRHGLNILRQLSRPTPSSNEPIARKVETLIGWFIRQVACWQATKIT